MVKDMVEKAVMKWYDTNYNSKPLFAKVKPELTPDTSLSTGKYPWARETGDEIMADYFKRFNVDSSGFDFLIYWPYEKNLLPNFFSSASKKNKNVEPQPLTLYMLIESAKVGRWIFG